MAASQDPFFLVKQEIQESVNELQGKYSRWSGLISSSPDRIKLGSDIERGCASAAWQLDELQHAIDKASLNPSRFHLSPADLDARQRWVRDTRGQVSNLEKSVKMATERARTGGGTIDSRLVEENNEFVNDQQMQHQQIVRRQNEDLDEMGRQVDRLGQVGLTIHDELTTHQHMLDDLDEDMDITNNRLRAAQKKIGEIIKKSGGKWQFIAIVTLVLVLVILLVVAFN